MKTRGKIIVGASFVLVAFIAGTIFFQMNKTDEGNFVSSNRADTNQVKDKEKADSSDKQNDRKDQTEHDENQNITTSDQPAEDGVPPVSQIQATPNQKNPNQESSVQTTPNQKNPNHESSAQTSPSQNSADQNPAATTPATGTGGIEPTAPAGNPSTGLHFSSREEAIQFGFSRFTAEEIALYNKASEHGLTPEQQEMAIQMAYSRFSAEEVAALKAALGE